MKIGAVDAYVNHPRLVIGGNLIPRWELMSEAGMIAHDRHHVRQSVTPQVELVHVEILQAPHEEPADGMTLVFDGVLEFPDGRVMVGDGIGGVHYTLPVFDAGPHAVKIWADETQYARRLTVLLFLD